MANAPSPARQPGEKGGSFERFERFGSAMRNAPGWHGAAWRYGIALTLTLGGIAFRVLLAQEFGARLLFFYPAIMISAFLGGFGPGLLSTLLGTGAAAMVWATAGPTLAAREGNATALIIHFILGVLISLLHEALNRAMRREQALRAVAEDFARERTAVLALVSHDLRNPLNTIAFSAAILEKAAPEGDAGREIRKRTAVLRRAIERMKRLIEDLLDATSLHAGRLSVELTPCDAGAMVKESAELFEPEAAAAGVTIVTEMPASPLTVRGDRGRLLQLLANLIGNALKFTPEGGTITIHVEPAESGAAALFSVRDSGVGLRDDQRESVFELYWKTGRNAGGGTGLGLYIARGIAEAHGGRIWAESVAGSGSSFRFCIPLVR